MLDTFAKLRKTTISFVISVPLSIRPSARMEQLGSHWTDFHEIRYLGIFQIPLERFQDLLKSGKKAGTLHQDRYKFLIIRRLILLRMRNISDKCCRENRNTHFMFNLFFFENRAFFR
jgi:hypothetical protein